MWCVCLAAARAGAGAGRAAVRLLLPGAGPSAVRTLFEGGRLQPHMNELPLPCIPWARYYRERQQYYNKWFCIGIVWLMFSIYMMVWSGSFYLNWGPPVVPAPQLESFASCDRYVDTSYEDVK